MGNLGLWVSQQLRRLLGWPVGSEMNRSLSVAWTPAVISLIAAGQAEAQSQYEYRFAFGSYCG